MKLKKFSSPFIEERLYLLEWYRLESCKLGSRPLLSRSGCICAYDYADHLDMISFSSPFIEERLYLKHFKQYRRKWLRVLVPFYRGAVVFKKKSKYSVSKVINVLVPFYRGAVVFPKKSTNGQLLMMKFSSPFIEERLYFQMKKNRQQKCLGSRPLLSRSGCIYNMKTTTYAKLSFSSPFIEERLYF